MPNVRAPMGEQAVRQFTDASGRAIYANVNVPSDAAGNVPSETSFQFAGATGGITGTADTPIAAAGAAGVRNYLTSLWFKNTSATASEIVIKDGASTVLWRGHCSASMTFGELVTFNPPLKGTAATALNVALLTTATATIVSAQGYTGA